MIDLLLIALVSGMLRVFYKKMVYSFYVRYPRHIHFYKNKTYRHFKGSFFIVSLFLIYMGIYHVYAHQLVIADISIKKYVVLPLAACLTLISSVDFKLYLISFTPLLFLLVLACVYQAMANVSWWLFFQNIAVIGIFLLIIYCASKKTIGQGDLYLLFTLSFWFDRVTWLWVLCFACLLGAFFSVINYCLKRRWAPSIAFAPWISINAWLFFLLSS